MPHPFRRRSLPSGRSAGSGPRVRFPSGSGAAPELWAGSAVRVAGVTLEASALPASVGLARARIGIGAPLLRLRSDEQLVTLFRAGNDEAFRVIHDRYRARLLGYARQMLLSSPADPEDAVQAIFVRAYSNLRSSG